METNQPSAADPAQSHLSTDVLRRTRALPLLLLLLLFLVFGLIDIA